ncbi:MAG: site-2 protease family protein [Deltaproteobacteria bacterium]|jgi:Zn-dependent protease|nr:site-2 protease family protein [Deltaproteobacteria bacterium]
MFAFFTADKIQSFLLAAPPLLLAVTMHEYAHGWMAWKKGDDTSRQLGRLSLNPLVHLDVVGTLVLLVTGFIGWAKPIPVNPSNFKKPAQDMAIVAIAGPVANFCLALIFLAVLAVPPKILGPGEPFVSLAKLLSPSIIEPLEMMIITSIFLNLGLAVFNLFPIPPLDGFKVLSFFVPHKISAAMVRFQIVFFIVLMLLIYFDVFSYILMKIAQVLVMII